MALFAFGSAALRVDSHCRAQQKAQHPHEKAQQKEATDYKRIRMELDISLVPQRIHDERKREEKVGCNTLDLVGKDEV